MQGKTARRWQDFGSERDPDKRADSANEKWPENPACCHKQIYLNACVAHDSFPLTGTNVLHDAFWLAEMHSLQYFWALFQGSSSISSHMKPSWYLSHSGELSRLSELARR